MAASKNPKFGEDKPIPPGQEKNQPKVKDWQKAVEAADERNALIAAWDEVNPGNRHTWKATRQEVETIWGKDAIRAGKLRNGYEYRGLPIELEE